MFVLSPTEISQANKLSLSAELETSFELQQLRLIVCSLASTAVRVKLVVSVGCAVVVVVSLDTQQSAVGSAQDLNSWQLSVPHLS